MGEHRRAGAYPPEAGYYTAVQAGADSFYVLFVHHVARHWRVVLYIAGPALPGFERFESEEAAMAAARALLAARVAADLLSGAKGDNWAPGWLRFLDGGVT